MHCFLDTLYILLSRFLEQCIMTKRKYQKYLFCRNILFFAYVDQHRANNTLHVWVFIISTFNNFWKNFTSFCIVHDAAWNDVTHKFLTALFKYNYFTKTSKDFSYQSLPKCQHKRRFPFLQIKVFSLIDLNLFKSLTL